MKPDNRGGARAGAGRPTTISATKTIGVRLDAANVEKLAALASQWQCTPSEAIRVMIAACPVKRPRGPS